MKSAPLRVFALAASKDLGGAISAALGQPLAAHEEREFEDGEHKARPLDAVNGADVYVVQSLHGGPQQSANDKLCRLLFFIGAIKDAGAARVTAVTPYLCYARKDRRTKPNDPVTTRYIAGMFESVGTDCVVTLEVHNPVAFENAFRCRTVALTGTPLFVDYVKTLADEKLSVISPDAGGMKRAELLREALEAALRPPGRQGAGGKAPQRRRGVGRSVRRRCGGNDRADRRRPDQHRQHAAARGPFGAQGRRQARDRARHAWAVHARRSGGDRRSGDRPGGRHRCGPGLPPRSAPRKTRSS